MKHQPTIFEEEASGRFSRATASALDRSPAPGAGGGPATHLDELLRRLRGHRPARVRFEVVRPIARGGMGEVLEAWDPDLRRRLALKSLRVRAAGGAERKEEAALAHERLLTRFLEEAQVTGQLSHPGIVPLHEMGLDEEGRPYFTMPLVRGRTLAAISDDYRAGRGGWTLARLVGVLQKVCEAVAYAHSKGVIHRDLKPANVMVGRFGEAYVMDWGLARVLERPDVHDVRPCAEPLAQSRMIRTDRGASHQAAGDSPLLTMDGDVIGTPAYMPPEQAAGIVDELGPRSDVYALGAILYFLLVGRDPYTPEDGRISSREVLAHVLVGPPEPISDLEPRAPEDLVAIAERAMSRASEHRYADALELAEDLAAFLEHRPVRAAAPGLGKVLLLWAQRHRGTAWTAGAAALLLMVLAAGAFWRVDAARRDERSARAESEARADVLLARDLLVREPRLHPATPRREAALAAWVGDARGLLERHADGPAEGPAEGEPSTSPFRADLAAIGERLPRVGERLVRARTLGSETIDDQRDAWERARAEVRESGLYGGLELEPQLGLVPLGVDPASGLQEFHHVLSGAAPEGAPGAWEIGARTGIVLVLLPGGGFSMGSPVQETGRHPRNEPLHERELAPFLIAKHEVTQGQWLRAMESNPARFQRAWVRSVPLDERHPVESVTWEEAAALAERLDLRLVREAEWEYAARGGTTTRTFGGASLGDLEGVANVKDVSARPNYTGGADWEDGYRYHAPVGSFAPNEFGLHDVLGNVMEWCADRFWTYPGSSEEPLQPGSDGRELQRMVRGGSWYHAPNQVRAARREVSDPRSVSFLLGVRLARSLSGAAPEVASED